MKRTAAVCLLLFAAGAARADEPAPAPALVKVPFEILKSKHMAVMVKVNGQGPFRLIFDTGAPYNLLSRKVAGAAGLGKKKPGLALPGLGMYKVNTLQLGDVRVENLQAMVFDHPTVKLLAKHVGPLEGIVGFSFFARYKVTIDYQKKELTFVPTKYRPPDAVERMMAMLFSDKSREQTVLAPAGVWGFRVGKKEGDTEPGVTVKSVLEGSPAAAAGLRAGDRLLTLAGRWTDTVADCYRAAGHARPGSAATLGIQRNGKEMELTVNVKAGL
jgi:hypothetical protein